MRYAFRTVGRALVVTTVVLLIGFAVIATSKFAMNSDMGLMTGVIIVDVAAICLLLLAVSGIYLYFKFKRNALPPPPP